MASSKETPNIKSSNSNEYADVSHVYSSPEKLTVLSPHNGQQFRFCPPVLDGETGIEMTDLNYEGLYAKPGEQYEEIPHTMGQQSPVDDPKKKPWPIVYRRDNAASYISDTSARRRFNPLYDASVSRTSLVTKDTDSTDKSLLNPIRCLCLVSVLFFLVATASLAISLYLLLTDGNRGSTNRTPAVIAPKTDQVQATLDPNVTQTAESLTKMWADVREIETQLDAFENQMSELKDSVDLLILNMSRNINDVETKLSNTTAQFTSEVDGLRLQWSNFSDSLKERFNNLSEILGEKAGTNLSKCFYEEIEETSTSNVKAAHWTDWVPSRIVLMKNTVMAATCSVEGGTHYNIESKHIYPEGRQYRCGCVGTVPSINFRKCTIHLWLCPRVL